MTAEVVEGLDIRTGVLSAWGVYVAGVCISLTDAREIAAALHRYDIAKAHEEAVNG